MKSEEWPAWLRRELAGCVSCGQCLPDCPIYGEDRREEASARGKWNVLKWHLVSGGQPSPEAARLFFRCALCLRCRESCPAGLDMLEVFASVREWLYRLGLGPVPATLGRARGAAARGRMADVRRGRPRAAGATLPTLSPRPVGGASPAQAPAAGVRTGSVLLVTSPLERAFGRRNLDAAGKLLATAGHSPASWAIRGPSPFRRWWIGDTGGARASLQPVLDAAAGRVVVFAEPELAWIARRLADPAAGGDRPEIRDLWELWPPTGVSVPDSGRPFIVWPPPVPLDANGWRDWNALWKTFAPDRCQPLPDAWRAWRAEGLAVACPDTARRLGRRLLEAVLAAGAPDLVFASTRSWLWLRQVAAPGKLPACHSLASFLLAARVR